MLVLEVGVLGIAKKLIIIMMAVMKIGVARVIRGVTKSFFIINIVVLKIDVANERARRYHIKI